MFCNNGKGVICTTKCQFLTRQHTYTDLCNLLITVLQTQKTDVSLWYKVPSLEPQCHVQMAKALFLEMAIFLLNLLHLTACQ